MRVKISARILLFLLALLVLIHFAPLVVSQEIIDHPGEKYEIEAAAVEVRQTDQGRVTLFHGGVTITHGAAVITAQSGKALEARDVAILRGEVRIVDGETEITSETGEYFRHDRMAHLFGNVVINDGRQLIQADEVVYYRDSRTAVATGSVSFKDAASDITVEGGTGTYYFEEGRGVMGESPILIASGEKQILVTARRMETFTKEGKASATGSVKVYQGDITASCDSLVYTSREEVASLLGSPTIVEGKNRAESVTVRLEFERRRLKRAVLKSAARGFYGVGEGESNEVFGDEMIIEFGDGKAEEVTVSGSARGLYLMGQKEE